MIKELLNNYRKDFELYSSCKIIRDDLKYIKDLAEFEEIIKKNNIGVIFYRIEGVNKDDYLFENDELDKVDFSKEMKLILRIWVGGSPIYTEVFENNVLQNNILHKFENKDLESD